MANTLPQNSLRAEQTWHARFEHLLKLLKENPPSKAAEFYMAALKEAFSQEEADDVCWLDAQLSLYPLRQPSLSLAINTALAILKDFDLEVLPGTMSSIVMGSAPDLWAGLQAAFSRLSSQGDVVMVLTLSNACPEPESKSA